MLTCVLGRRIQTREHDSVEDARASMDLFKRVKSEWKSAESEVEDQPLKSNTASLKRQRSEDNFLQQTHTERQCAKRPRLDSETVLFLSDSYWPDDIQVCWF